MRVLFIGPLPEPMTGHSLACQVFLSELVRRHTVDVVDLSKHGNGVLSRIVEVLWAIWNVWRKRNTCDVIYFTISESYSGNIKDLLIYLACFRRLSRMAIHLHGGAGMRKIMLDDKGLFRHLNDFFLRRLGAVIVLGNRLADIFSSSVPNDKIYVVPNFAEDYLFASPDVIARKFEQLNPLKVLFLSNCLPGKGHLELAEAFRALDESARKAIRIDFAGTFPSIAEQNEFSRLIESCPQLHYHGAVRGEVKKRLFHDAHVFCLPTYYPYEGQPISILEAYASGCAVITTSHSGILDIFTNGVNGYEVAKASSHSLKGAIQDLLINPYGLYMKGLANYNYAQSRFRTKDYNAKLLAVIDAVSPNVTHNP